MHRYKTTKLAQRKTVGFDRTKHGSAKLIALAALEKFVAIPNCYCLENIIFRICPNFGVVP